MLHFKCACGKSLQADECSAGKKAKCPACQGVVTIPAPPLSQVDLEGHERAVKDAPPEALGSASFCPDCGAGLPSGAVLCTACGLDLRSGRKVVEAGREDAACHSQWAVRAKLALGVLLLAGLAVGALTVYRVRRERMSRHRISCSLGRLRWTRADRNAVLVAFEFQRPKEMPIGGFPSYEYSMRLPNGARCTFMFKGDFPDARSADKFIDVATRRYGFDTSGDQDSEEPTVSLPRVDIVPQSDDPVSTPWAVLWFNSPVPDPTRVILEGGDLPPVTLELPIDVTWP